MKLRLKARHKKATMPSLFLSHASCDKPFVEKLANDLKRIGVNVWFDKWEIRVGEFITPKIEAGVRANEFLGIVLSPESLNSEWVKSEMNAAWSWQMDGRQIGVLPILYRVCAIPSILADRRYADFRSDYQEGFMQLAGVLGIQEIETISVGNWRRFIKSRTSEWKKFRDLEFERLVTALVDRAKEYNWSSCVGRRRNPFSITLNAFIDRERKAAISLKLNGRTLAYMANLDYEWNPNHLKSADFNVYVGNTVNECEEFVWRRMEDFSREHGKPTEQQDHYVERCLSWEEIMDLSEKMVKEVSWYKGERL